MGAGLGKGLGEGFFGSGDFSDFDRASGNIVGSLQRGAERAEDRAFRIEDREDRQAYYDDARQTSRGFAVEDRDLARANQVSDRGAARELFLEDRDFAIAEGDRVRRASTDEAIRRAEEVSTLGQFGVPSSELGELTSIYGAGPGQGPTPSFGGAGAPTAPVDVPGPSQIPGMEKVWGPVQWRALSALENKRNATIGNPAWVKANGPEAVEMQKQALANRFSQIRTTTRPAQPRPTMPGSDGQRVPIPLGVIPDVPGVGPAYFDGATLKPVSPTKHYEANNQKYSFVDPETGQNVEQAFGTTVPYGKNQSRTVDSRGIHIEEIPEAAAPGRDWLDRARKGVRYDSLNQEVTPASQFGDEAVEEVLAAFLGEIRTANPDFITWEEYQDLDRRITEQYGFANRVPEEIDREFRKLGERFGIKPRPESSNDNATTAPESRYGGGMK
jgi:hypothetical protein